MLTELVFAANTVKDNAQKMGLSVTVFSPVAQHFKPTIPEAFKHFVYWRLCLTLQFSTVQYIFYRMLVIIIKNYIEET